MPSHSNKRRQARPLLGTIVEITAMGTGIDTVKAIHAAFGAVECVQRLMSFHDPESDISRINAAAAYDEITIDIQTYQVLQFAIELGALSDGVFDIATADILVRHGFLPSPQHTVKINANATYRDLELLGEQRVRWRRKGCIDLGGIAKGYAVDRAIAVLRSSGVHSGVVNAGGDLRCFGDAQPISVRHPTAPASLIPLGWLSDAAIATSSGYFSAGSGNDDSINPLVDPQRQVCTTWNESVSVLAQTCMTADALTKIVRLAPEAAPDLLARFEAQAVVIDGQAMRCCGASLLQQEAMA